MIVLSLIGKLRVINDKLLNKIQSKSIPSYDKQNSYLQSFPEPHSDLERSFYQYKCQNFSCENWFSLILKNLSAIVLMPIYMGKKYQKQEQSVAQGKILYLSVNNKLDMLPRRLADSEDLLVIQYDGFQLTQEDKSYIRAIMHAHPWAFYFNFKLMLKIGLYSAIIDAYHPKEIVIHGETSFTASILTKYCESRSVRHTNVMHGEKVFWIRDSFFRFSDCYVWSQYHIDLFRQMRATGSNYIISLPPALCLEFPCAENGLSACDYKFYLGYETKTTLKILSAVTAKLSNHGKTFILRPHPIYTNINLLMKYFDGALIESPVEVSIERSLMSARNVVSIYSTVLRQADNGGIRVIVDDCTNPKKYEEIKNLRFWLYEKDHNLLSNEVLSIA